MHEAIHEASDVLKLLFCVGLKNKRQALTTPTQKTNIDMNEGFTTYPPFGRRRAVGEGKEQQQHARIISFVGSEVLTRLSDLGWNSEEARAGAQRP
jgi:hypothetical protein